MDRNDLRIGDAEREHAMAALREHFAQGRLTHEELDERLDRTLAAKTARDLAQVTADLPGKEPAYDYRAPQGPWDRAEWHAAMHAHRHQLQSQRREAHAMHRDRRREWARRHGRRGPHPFVGVLFVLMVLSLIFGFGVFKVLFALWLGAMVFSLVHRRFHYRG
ncbi:DUF1707 domain-containing protein [Nonomuraea sp. NPDC049480]|uniref:DUF1707 domain-containing protein n=1 Tax=Nonomuraea sp. NPDC049480 TaxID=3364353 RepID=UPI003791B15E